MDIIRTANGWNLSVVGIGGRVVYVQQEVEGARPKFVAVFKYNRPATNARAFVKFLVKNFTPAEYFARMEAGHAPLQILAAYGYVSPNQRAAMAVKLNAKVEGCTHGAAYPDCPCTPSWARPQ